jgi:hypothetical protein
MVTSLQLAIEEICEVQESLIRQRVAKEREDELTGLMVDCRVLGVRSVGEGLYEMMLENHTTVKFRYRDVTETVWSKMK